MPFYSLSLSVLLSFESATVNLYRTDFIQWIFSFFCSLHTFLVLSHTHWHTHTHANGMDYALDAWIMLFCLFWLYMNIYQNFHAFGRVEAVVCCEQLSVLHIFFIFLLLLLLFVAHFSPILPCQRITNFLDILFILFLFFFCLSRSSRCEQSSRHRCFVVHDF